MVAMDDFEITDRLGDVTGLKRSATAQIECLDQPRVFGQDFIAQLHTLLRRTGLQVVQHLLQRLWQVPTHACDNAWACDRLRSVADAWSGCTKKSLCSWIRSTIQSGGEK